MARWTRRVRHGQHRVTRRGPVGGRRAAPVLATKVNKIDRLGTRGRQRSGEQRGERNTGQGEKVRTTTGHTFERARLGQARVMFLGVGSWRLGGIKCLGNLAGHRRHGLIDMHVKRHGSQTKRTAKGNETSDIPRRDSHRKNERAARSSFQTHWRRGEAKGEDI